MKTWEQSARLFHEACCRMTFHNNGNDSHRKQRAQVICHESRCFFVTQGQCGLHPERRQKADDRKLEAAVEKEEKEHEDQHKSSPRKCFLKISIF